MVEASDKDPSVLTLSIVNVGPGLQYHAVDRNVDPKELDESCGTSSMVRVRTAMTIPVSKARMSNDGSLWVPSQALSPAGQQCREHELDGKKGHVLLRTTCTKSCCPHLLDPKGPFTTVHEATRADPGTQGNFEWVVG